MDPARVVGAESSRDDRHAQTAGFASGPQAKDAANQDCKQEESTRGRTTPHGLLGGGKGTAQVQENLVPGNNIRHGDR